MLSKMLGIVLEVCDLNLKSLEKTTCKTPAAVVNRIYADTNKNKLRLGGHKVWFRECVCCAVPGCRLDAAGMLQARTLLLPAQHRARRAIELQPHLPHA